MSGLFTLNHGQLYRLQELIASHRTATDPACAFGARPTKDFARLAFKRCDEATQRAAVAIGIDYRETE